MNLTFNKPHLTGKEAHYIYQAVYNNNHISGNGEFTKKCHAFFEQRYNFNKVLMTTSCTDALEMAAILLNIQSGDEVIMPSYTFVSTANAFILRGAKIVFADSNSHNPNIDVDKIESLITSKTKAIIPVHYAGMACDMGKIMKLAKKYNLFVVEDAAQAIESSYKGQQLGGIGDLGTFSFHETKNINAGEGGLLIINNQELRKRAEIIWEKGTNRAQFFRGEVNKYGWVDMGSSFLPSDIISAYLYAQLENLDDIQSKRQEIWHKYYKELKEGELEGYFKLPILNDYMTNNAHMFYLITNKREELIKHLRNKNIHAVFHYLSLHTSPFYKEKHDGRKLKYADFYTENLVRLPLYYDLKEKEIEYVCQTILDFFRKSKEKVMIGK